MSEETLALDIDHVCESGVITDKAVCIWGYMVDTDALNDVSIEIWDSVQKRLIVPKVVWAATQKDKKPLTFKARYSKKGLMLKAKTNGYFRFIPLYQNWLSN